MPTIRRCCIVGCMSNSRQNPQLQFFQFPKPENPFHKLWKGACEASLSRILPFKKPVVCALHFHSNCIGGRRLTATAVPSLRLEVPSNLKAVEQQAMVDEIERSRKYAYINAVVYEWLVRANLNPQLRGSITHGMIKEKAESARQLIGSTSFTADNRWLNRFRETHLTGFAQKLALNQLKPLGPSLWIPDIVQDLQHLFPPTSADRCVDFGNVPEQYIDYMRQYGEFEEEDDQSSSSYQDHTSNSFQDHTSSFKTENQQSYQEQQQQSHYQQQQQMQLQQNHHHQQQNHHIQQQQHPQYDAYNSPQSANYDVSAYYKFQTQLQTNNYPQRRPSSHSPSMQSKSLQSSPLHRASPYQPPVKKLKLPEPDDDDGNASEKVEAVEDLTDGPASKETPPPPSNTNGNAHNSNNNSNHSVNIANTNNANSNNKTQKGERNGGSVTPNGYSSGSTSPKPVANGHSTAIGSPKLKMVKGKEIESYLQAIEYMKPLEDFVLINENFRAIGLISQLETVLRNSNGHKPDSDPED